MSSISYGGFAFLHPLPFVAEDVNPISISGSIDHLASSISLIGEITGCDLTSIKLQKENLIHALSSGFQPLVIGSTGYDYAKPTAIKFASSDLRRRLPYQIDLECYSSLSFSNFYGISDPVDVWNFSEGEGRQVKATHNVSAKGYKKDGSSFENARSFVNGRLNGFNNNLSSFFSGQTVILTSKNEDINRVSNTYGITEEWQLSESNNLDKNGCIIRADCSIQYNSQSNLSIGIRGTILGGISGSVDTGYFTKEDATIFAKNAVLNSKTLYEDNLYGDILKEPLSYKYGVDSGSNSISFDFSFKDPTDLRTGEVLHDYSSTISTSKDDPFSSASVKGAVFYNSNISIFSTGSPETQDRWKKVDAFFSGVNPFPIAQQHYSWFRNSELPYNQSDLSDIFTSFSISKSPYSASIDYDYSYSNRPDFFSGLLRNVDLTIETTYPIPSYKIQPTTDNSFAVQDAYDTIERKSISLNASLTTGVNFNTAIAFVNQWVLQYSGNGGVLLEDSLQTGSNAFSLKKTFTKP